MQNIFIANITIKAKTPLKVASGQKDFLQDSPIQKDWNDLPMILGTSLAGVLRKEFDDDLAKELFGSDNPNDDKAHASRLIISNALLLDEKHKATESLLLEKSDFLKEFEILVKREHNSINDKGVTNDTGKFDEEVLYAGTKFKFSISFLSDNCEEDKKQFFEVLNILSQNSFRIGGGSTKGFGQIEIESIDYDIFDMSSSKFVNFENSLNTKLEQEFKTQKQNDEKYISYEISLKPDDFFMFGSGFGSSDADMTAVYEKVVSDSYDGFTKKKVLIPASSVKGAISHRTTYHYNKLNEIYIASDKKPIEVVESIFGAKKDTNKDNEEVGFKGKLLISDIYVDEFQEKVFDHVAIDRFTGGAIDGALFQEKTINTKEEIKLEILLEKNIEDEKAIKAFENTLDDLTSGILSLGGATTKGHGIFTGEWKKC